MERICCRLMASMCPRLSPLVRFLGTGEALKISNLMLPCGSGVASVGAAIIHGLLGILTSASAWRSWSGSKLLMLMVQTCVSPGRRVVSLVTFMILSWSSGQVSSQWKC